MSETAIAGGRETGALARLNALVPIRLRRRGWGLPHFVTGAVLLLVGFLVTSDAWKEILYIAGKDEESSHIFLVPVVAIWLVWVRRGRFRYCEQKGRLVGPLFIAIGWFCYSWGDLNRVEVLWQLGAVIVLIGCFITVAGSDIFVRFLPAFVVLAFLVPVPGRIRAVVAMPLQGATAKATYFVLDLFGTAVERAGNQLTINDVDVMIAEACNGLRMVFALVLVSFAFAYGLPLRNYVRILILVLSPVSAILCNVIRLVPTVWVYGEYSEEFAAGFHDVTGWVMLPIAFLILLGIVRLFRWALIPVTRYTLAHESW